MDSRPRPVSDAEIEFLELHRASEQTLDEFYTTLLEATFPTDELETLEQFKEGLERNANGVLALIDGRVAGGLVHEHYVNGSVQLLGYLVVDSAMRNQGLGRKLLHLGLRQSTSVLALGEVEDPRFWRVSKENDPVSRLRFWAREGCRLLPLPYVQPALGSRSGRVPHLLLIAVPKGSESPPDRVPGQLVEKFLREYYSSSEGSISESDPELQRMLAACSAEWLRLWPLDRLDVADEPG